MLFEKSTLLAIGLDALQWAITGAVGVWVYLVGRQTVRSQSLHDMEARIERRLDDIDSALATATAERAGMPAQRDCAVHTARIATLEALQSQAPKHTDIAHAHTRIDALSESISEVKGSLKRIERTTDMISQYLMDHPHHGGGSQ
jgi:hypothetical protein